MKLNSFILKVLACIFMTIDHIGALLLPNSTILRVIGRLAFPIFAFLITEGYNKTKNLKKYQKRLLMFALISQIPYIIAFNTMDLNIFFTLLAGLYSINVINKNFNIEILAEKYHFKIKNTSTVEKFIKILLILVIGIICDLLGTDYGSYGILLVIGFYLFKNNTLKLSVYFSLINIVQVLLELSARIAYEVPIELNLFLQLFSIFSIFIIRRYNNEQGPKLKYGFYVYYPLHLMVLTYIRCLII